MTGCARAKTGAVQVIATLVLLLFSFQALANHKNCACGHCNGASEAKSAPVAAEPQTEHCCCHHHDDEAATKAAELHDPGCTCGDETDGAPAVFADAKVGVDTDLLALGVSWSALRVETRPSACVASGWLHTTGPPDVHDQLFLRFHALLI